MNKQRETWVDAIKVLACILVVLGQLFQSMVKANILDSTATYTWFYRTIQYFHMPLLFLCCGYLYQQGKPVKTTDDWLANITKKLVTIGVPFLVFAGGNWLLKFAFSEETQIDSLLLDLVIQPVTPYWVLYTLILIFLVTPTMYNKISAIALAGVALGAKAVSVTMGNVGIYAVDTLLGNWLWFVLGMVLAFVKAPKVLRKQKGIRRLGLVLLVAFFVGSIAVVMRSVSHSILSFMFGVFGCSAILVLAVTMKYTDQSRGVILWLSDYSLPVLLMNGIFARILRNVLLNAGITNAILHIAAGIVVSFGCPILVGFVMKKLKWPEFILYPDQFVKFRSSREKTKKSE